VYRAHDRMLERPVAVKILHDHYVHDEEAVERFQREARSAAQLAHPNIVTVIDRGEEDGRPYIVFEYVEGENLKQLVAREGALPVGTAVELGIQIAQALEAAHERGVVHRDVKPQNVLLADEGRVKVTDFGIARSSGTEGLTLTGTIMGTSDYIAPEQARGARVDEQSDIYSLGAVLYELLTAEVPFRGDNFVAVAMQHINEPPPSVRERRPDVSPRLDAAIRRAMAKEPRDRFGSMDELCTELSACLGPESVVSGAETMVVSGRRPPHRRRQRGPRAPAGRPSIWPLILLLAGLAVLAGILAAVFAFTDPGSQLSHLVGKTKTSAKLAAVHFTSATAYDPYGDNHSEHDPQAREAIDHNPATYWYTEHYSGGLNKPGVGLVLDAGASKQLTQLVVRSDTQGFTARIESGSVPTGGFKFISGPQVVGGNTTFTLKGGPARYYVVWITDLGSNSSVKINEVTARGS
jgi:serine/threonine-protein kinase